MAFAHDSTRTSRRYTGVPAPVAQGIERAPPEREVAGSNPARRMTRSTHSYGSHPSQLGELFLPDGPGPHPVVVVVHGGYWRARYDRSLMDGLCLDLGAHGLAAWNLEYRRVGCGGRLARDVPRRRGGRRPLGELDAPLDLRGWQPSGTRPAVNSRSGRRPARHCRPTRPVRDPGRIRAAVSQAGVLDLTLAAGLSRPPRRRGRFWEIRPSITSATCSRHPASGCLSASPSSCCTASGTTGFHADRDELRGSRARRRRPVRAGRPLAAGTSSTSTRARKRGTSRATGSSLGERAAQLSHEALESARPVLGGQERGGTDDDAVRELRSGGGLLRRRDAESRVQRRIRERSCSLHERRKRR